ncbi:tetratricopeptide repeat protein [Psychrosphaera haliotis]|uniref:tetratricopeptide repeat protein n=1 Tax=Psychrosphaera haliotis TaxID=555083 RepID=UPI0018C51B9E|nr:tetratricopeptide repeat protein [Psychrosphaera haliotis]
MFIEASVAQDQHPEYVVLHSLFLMQELQPKKALQLLENIKNSPQLPANYWPLFAELNLKLENFNEAIAGYENWSATEQNALASLRLVYLYQYSNRLEKALATAKLGTQRFNNVVFKYLTVDMLLNKASVQEAKQVFNSIQAGKYAEMLEWQTLKGRFAAIDGDFKLALSTFKKVYDETHSPLLVKFITGVYRMTNNYPAASAFLESHLEMYPADLNTWQVKFNVEIQKDPLKAEYAALKITELAPNDSIAFNNLAWFELQNNKIALAAKHIEKAIELNNKNPELFDTASQIAMKQGNKTKAIEYIKSAITLAPNSATYRATLKEIESK